MLIQQLRRLRRRRIPQSQIYRLIVVRHDPENIGQPPSLFFADAGVGQMVEAAIDFVNGDVALAIPYAVAVAVSGVAVTRGQEGDVQAGVMNSLTNIVPTESRVQSIQDRLHHFLISPGADLLAISHSLNYPDQLQRD